MALEGFGAVVYVSHSRIKIRLECLILSKKLDEADVGVRVSKTMTRILISFPSLTRAGLSRYVGRTARFASSRFPIAVCMASTMFSAGIEPESTFNGTIRRSKNGSVMVPFLHFPGATWNTIPQWMKNWKRDNKTQRFSGNDASHIWVGT